MKIGGEGSCKRKVRGRKRLQLIRSLPGNGQKGIMETAKRIALSFAALTLGFALYASSSERESVLLVAQAMTRWETYLLRDACEVVWENAWKEQAFTLDVLEERIADQKDLQGTSSEEVASTLKYLRAINPDIIGWVSVSGTNVSLPIAQGLDDEYYLSHDAFGRRVPFGCAFLAHAAASDFKAPVTVIYGHTCSNADLVFTELHCCESANYLREHGNLVVTLMDGKTLECQVVSARLMRDDDLNVRIANATGEDLADYYAYLVSETPHGMVRDDICFDPRFDRLVQLSTCSVPSFGEGRTVVTAVWRLSWEAGGVTGDASRFSDLDFSPEEIARIWGDYLRDEDRPSFLATMTSEERACAEAIFGTEFLADYEIL